MLHYFKSILQSMCSKINKLYQRATLLKGPPQGQKHMCHILSTRKVFPLGLHSKGKQLAYF